jgi:(R)-2-hydroxyacyl-CoA dehydratese activating ATPase
MMYVLGCDVGSLSAKAVIMKNGEIVASQVIYSKPEPKESAKVVIDKALEQAGLDMKDIRYCVSTGYGRKSVPFVNDTESEIVCHGRGAKWRMPSVHMVIDIGGQDAKVIRVDDSGNVLQYVYNDRCASGTGRFIEVMAAAMDVPLGKMGELSALSKDTVSISNQCVVFAETEIISLVNAGKPLPDIVGALHKSLAGRVAALARGVQIEKEVAMTGGVAKNEGMVKALEEMIGTKIVKSDIDPQIMGALGAALIAGERLDKS